MFKAIRVMIMVSNLSCSAVHASEWVPFGVQYVRGPGNNIFNAPHDCFPLGRVRAAR